MLVVSPVFPPARGGIETLTWDIVQGLADWRREIVTLREPASADWDAASGLKVHRAPNRPRGGRRALIGLSALALVRGLRFRPDVVLCMYIRCAPASRALSAILGARWVQYYHAREIPEYPRMAAWAAAHADAHVAVSRYTAELVRGAGAREAAVHVIPPAVADPTTGREAARLDRAPDRGPVLLSLSRLDDGYKGHEVVLTALPQILAHVPRARWVIAGDGTLKAGLARAIETAGMADHVELRGFVSAEERDSLLRDSDVFVLPSRVPADGRGGEGFGIVFVEAAAHGLPVVAARAGGVIDAVEDADLVPEGGTGLLVDGTDPAAVAGAVLRILSDPPLAARLRHRGPGWATEFSVERLIGDLEPVLLGR